MDENCSRNEAVKKVHGEFLLTEQGNVRLVYHNRIKLELLN